MLTIYNSLSKKKEPFKPLTPGKVRMYVCGMTVYDYLHLGHARVMVVFDMVVRYMRSIGLDVTYVRNITDIDDKIIKRAQENNEDISTLTKRFIDAMNKDAAVLGVAIPDAEPRATDHMPQILAMIAALIEHDYAYVAASGDVFYRVRKFPPYGALSGKSLDELHIGARVDVDESKDDPLDFVLWKAAKPGEPSWDSPWGAGRPGWHIECSAMSTHCLGEHFDIHGGGMDLKFPHHENEIAQSEAVSSEKFVDTWMHVGFVRVNEEKMSKSLGNFFTVREILKDFDPEVVRYFILTSHYRSPLDYSDASLKQAKAGLTTLYTALRGIDEATTGQGQNEDTTQNKYTDRYITALNDDFNTPEAIAVLFDLGHEINRLRNDNPARARQFALQLHRLGGVMGLLQSDPDAFLQGAEGTGLTTKQIEGLIAERTEARKNRNWSEADRIRKELTAQGIVLEDVAADTTWRRV